jgi:ABC-type multidrug transport system ATPase subunit
MKIDVQNVGKKYGKQWVFRNLNKLLLPKQTYAITGPNGCGKSTLLKTMAGMLSPNEGKIICYHNDTVVKDENLYNHLTYCAPYMELPEELTLAELLYFHDEFRPMSTTISELIKILEIDADKEIRNCSSGMKQRIKLALAVFTKTDMVMLDEPTSNFDSRWIGWYKDIIASVHHSKTLLICSNVEEEYSFADHEIKLGPVK